MKQILKPDHPVVLKSIAICTVASAIVVADAISPIPPAGADNYTYSRVDRHCQSGINRAVSIDLGTAARIEEAVGQPIDAVGLNGMQPYCFLADKTAPNGAWSQAAVLPISTGPIEAPPQVLVVYFATRASTGLYTLTGTERWNVPSPDWHTRITQSLEGRMVRGAVQAVNPNQEACQ